MHLDQIANLRNSTTGLDAKRHAAAEENLYFGMGLLQRLEDTDFAQPELLKDACRALIEAMRQNSRDERPPLALAYLFMLIEEFNTAVEYLAEARRITPNNPVIDGFEKAMQDLKAEIKKAEQAEAKAQAQAHTEAMDALATANEDEIDYDELYDRTEALIIEKVRELASYPQPEPTGDAKKIKELSKYQKQLQTILEHLQAQLKIVDEEIEVGELETKLKPLEVISKRYNTAIEVSQQLQQLVQRIAEEHQLVQDQLNALPEIESPDDLKIMEENLDGLLDVTDQIADEIETLDKQGYAVQDIEKKYDSLVKDVEKLQDAIDDISEKF